MKIEEIRLTHFRNYDHMTLNPHEGINLLFGQNGSGKTNLLEAIHYCSLGKSHRMNNDQSIVEQGEKEGSCIITLRNQTGKRNIAVQFTPSEPQKKNIFIDQKKINRFSDLMGCLQCVIFSPEDLAIVREGPSVRRRYLDMMISQINRGYFIALQRYRSAMEQRNALLKTLKINGGSVSYLEDFEQAMAQPAQVIIEERIKIIDLLTELVKETYTGISGREDEVFSVSYRSSLAGSDRISEEFMEILKKNRDQDIQAGMTLSGPHRDDLHLLLNRMDMKNYASQGQVRTAALSLKLSQLKLLWKISGEEPVLLLDDVMSELDRTRRSRLLQEIEPYQTFVTCTDESDLEESHEKRVYLVASDSGKGKIEMSKEGYFVKKAEMKEPCFT